MLQRKIDDLRDEDNVGQVANLPLHGTLVTCFAYAM
jgi:hypothetical protein